ncbi:hypothetical protein [Bradyrhizobium erythrophlei]|jgi:hypothetical protein|uniref:C2H2-type domain-containing protein n=1 Tax=Bradyrhizobium erythrophlei TaxID=1437360 RepID=A0A1M5KCE1_9BRAD|nr:hypothetical protein [Bradyrhizobium erythrophlei]SHG50290.1 hypothetical protein SAMN05443248_1767 [Bradyrhizobium erythrophlei]
MIRRYTGVDADGIAESDADHSMRCPGCGEWFDMRDLSQVLAHIHDAEVEIGMGQRPPERREH